MRIIVRRAEELFSTTAARLGGAYKAIVNGNYYDVTFAGKVDAFAGSDPVPAAETLVEGHLVSGVAVVASTGKTVLAYSSAASRILVIAQPHGTAGITHDALRDKLALAGVDHAVFLDGSDSTMLMVGSNLLVRSGQNKDELNVVGVGFQ